MKYPVIIALLFSRLFALAQQNNHLYVFSDSEQLNAAIIRADNEYNFFNDTFKIDLNLSDKVFNSHINFNKSVFLKEVNFEHSLFDSSVFFTNVKFNDFVNFKYVTLQLPSNFENVMFDSSVSFVGTRFNSSTDFSSAKFYSTKRNDVELLEEFDSKFGNIVEGIADFSAAEFNSTADFSSVEFGTMVFFYKTKFRGKINFRNTVFKDTVTFSEAEFYSNVDFTGVQFKKLVDFSEIELLNNSVLDLSRATFREDERVRINLSNADISKIKLRYGDFLLDFSEEQDKPIIETTYKNLISRLIELNYIDDAETLDKEYQQWKFLKKDPENKRWLVNFLLKHWWGYGYDKHLIFRNTFFIFLFFFLVNMWLIRKLNLTIYPIEIISQKIEKTRGESFFKRQFLKIPATLVYTGLIFFGVYIKLESLKNIKVLENRFPYLIYFIIMYLSGILCLGFLANFIFSS